MDARDLYDFDEYFMRYMRVHPALTFDPIGLDALRLSKQRSLLESLSDNLTTIAAIRERYSLFIAEVRESKIAISDLEYRLECQKRKQVDELKKIEEARLTRVINELL